MIFCLRHVQVAAAAVVFSSFVHCRGEAGGPAVTGANATSAREPSADAQPCRADQLELDDPNVTDAAMSHRVVWLRMKNVARSACVVGGYPRVAALQEDGAPLKERVAVEESPASYLVSKVPVERLTLAPAGVAYFAVSYTIGGPCDGTLIVPKLGVWPPGTDGAPQRIKANFSICAPSSLTISPLTSDLPR